MDANGDKRCHEIHSRREGQWSGDTLHIAVGPTKTHHAKDKAQALGDALRQLDQIILSAENKAPRFALTVKEGEATTVDDFLMSHYRDAFVHGKQ